MGILTPGNQVYFLKLIQKLENEFKIFNPLKYNFNIRIFFRF